VVEHIPKLSATEM